MCDNKNVLLIMTVLKIIVLIILPLFLIIFRKNEKLRIYVSFSFIVEIILLVLFIIMSLFKNDCFVLHLSNSRNLDFSGEKFLKENSSSNSLKTYTTNRIYKSYTGSNVYYFSNNTLPLSNKSIGCNNEAYIKHYGNGLAAVATLISTKLDTNIDPIELLTLASKNNLVDCENGIDLDSLLELVAKEYSFNVLYASPQVLESVIKNGDIALGKIRYDSSGKNITCEDSNIIIYNIDKDSNFVILDPNNKDYDYVCPENSAGYGDVITKDNNKKTFTLDEINNITYTTVILRR